MVLHDAVDKECRTQDNGRMTPDEALRMQISRYRQMTGEERLAIGLRLHELACSVAREGIRHQYPNSSEEEVERLLRQRLRLARGA